jgi:hypothetical protein
VLHNDSDLSKEVLNINFGQGSAELLVPKVWVLHHRLPKLIAFKSLVEWWNAPISFLFC